MGPTGCRSDNASWGGLVGQVLSCQVVEPFDGWPVWPVDPPSVHGWGLGVTLVQTL